jgi:heme-degrading monooxygenase HmoA
VIMAVFRARIREERAAEYYQRAEEMAEIARSMPGFISYKAYTSPPTGRSEALDPGKPLTLYRHPS